MTVIAASAKGDTVTIVFSLAWWLVAAAIGAWIGRMKRPTARIETLLAQARSSSALPAVKPQSVLLNRLWPLGVSALIAAGISWLLPQVASVATGYAILVALAWRRQEAAVSAIEGRDGAQFYVLPTSPLAGISLMRTPGYRHILEESARRD